MDELDYDLGSTTFAPSRFSRPSSRCSVAPVSAWSSSSRPCPVVLQQKKGPDGYPPSPRLSQSISGSGVVMPRPRGGRILSCPPPRRLPSRSPGGELLCCLLVVVVGVAVENHPRARHSHRLKTIACRFPTTQRGRRTRSTHVASLLPRETSRPWLGSSCLASIPLPAMRVRVVVLQVRRPAARHR